jgi:hypothetical protein
MKNFRLQAALLVALAMPAVVHADDAQRQADVARRGAEVMPFSLKATTHVFTVTADGGTQRVVAKSLSDTKQVDLVRAHLHDLQARFLKGDFSGPSHIHGAEMPGLAELESAQAGQVAIEYKDVAGGAELTYRTADPKLVVALHAWFDAQLHDHGSDAMAGHAHHHHDVDMPGQ